MNLARSLASANSWRDAYNPLRGLTLARAVQLMEAAQRGVMADLQWLYASELGIEATDPDLMTIVERTVAGVADMDWQILAADDSTRGYDKVLADEQKAFLEESYTACDNLPDAIEHLVMARFRGFAHLQPWTRPDGTLEHLEPLPQWNMVRDGSASRWAWNPRAEQVPYDQVRGGAFLSPADYILCENRRPVNRIALIKYIRATVAEKDWDAYVEIYGIPGVFIVMPPDIPQGKEEEYAQKAEEAAEAASGALPNGSDVKTLSEIRGVQPFQMRLEWLQKQLVLAGTGGMLTMLSEPTGIGGGATGAQEGVWNTIVRRIDHTVEAPFNRQYDRRVLAARFPGRPALAHFALRTRQEKDVGSAVQNIAALAAAGYRVDPAQVAQETGYDVSLAPQTPPAAPATPAYALNAAENPAILPKNDPDGPHSPDGRGRSPLRHDPKNPQSPAQKALAALAAQILDGSIPFEDALRNAQKTLETLDPALLASDLEKTLEREMFAQAAKATEKAPETPVPDPADPKNPPAPRRSHAGPLKTP